MVNAQCFVKHTLHLFRDANSESILLYSITLGVHIHFKK